MSTPMTPAQAAQNRNRTGGGQYKEKTHGEASLDLAAAPSPAVEGFGGRVHQVVVGKDLMQVDLTSGDRIEARSDGRMRLLPDDGRARRVVGEHDMELRRLAQRDLGVLPGENPWNVISQLRTAALEPEAMDPVLEARSQMVQDLQYQGALARLHESSEQLRSRHGALTQEQIQRARLTHRLTGADDRERERLHRGARALREAEQCLFQLHELDSVQHLCQQLGIRAPRAPEALTHGLIESMPATRFSDGTVCVRTQSGQEVEVTDIVADYAHERRVNPKIATSIVPERCVEPQDLELTQDPEVATAQQRARAQRQWEQTVQMGPQGPISCRQFMQDAGVRARVVDLDPESGRRRYRLATQRAGDQSISASLYRCLDKVPEANTALGHAELEAGAEAESVRTARRGEAGPELERALLRQDKAAQRLRELRDQAQQANAELLQRRRIRILSRIAEQERSNAIQ